MKKKEPVAQAPPRRLQIAAVTPAPDTGLTAREAAYRRENGYGNEPVNPPSKTVRQIILSNVLTYFNFVFLGLAICLAAVGAFKDMLFLLIVAANALIGIVQELRAKATIDKLTLLSAPQTTVVRDGREYAVATDCLVRDDIVIFSAGNQIPADGAVLTGEVQVNEALITGESEAITKRAGDELLSGSFILSGKCRACLTRVGEDSYVSRLTLEAKRTGGPKQSEMMSALTRLIRLIGMLIIPLGVILFCKQKFLLELSVQETMTSTVAALIGMIPEGLYLLTSVALFVSVMRLAKQKTLVHELNCIETLARVDVLCVDKTGTITENVMAVNDLIPLASSGASPEALRQTLSDFYASMEADNDTAKAMGAFFTQPAGWRAAQVVPFTSAAKWSAVSFAEHGTFAVGAPEFILRADYAGIQERVERYSAEGNRVLLLAQCGGLTPEKQLGGEIRPLALILLSNKIRENAPDTFRYFAEQGVAVKVISGDNPLTVSQVAQRAGIAGGSACIDASTLHTDAEISDAVERYTVFGRVTPDQKRKFVGALKQAGHTVAMTGDGVNDVLALKDADCSIAMASGSDAACHVSQLVLLDSDFGAMPHVVAEGRRVINNIERAASLFLVKNIFSFLLSLISIFVTMQYPVTPLQLSLISGLTIGIPSFFLALEPNNSLVRGHFLRNVFHRALPGGLTDLLLVGGLLLYAAAFGFTADESSTICALMLAFVGLLILFQVCKPIDWKRGAIWGVMSMAMVFAVTVFGPFFSLERLSPQPGLILLLFLLLAYPVLYTLLRVNGSLQAGIDWMQEKAGALRKKRTK